MLRRLPRVRGEVDTRGGDADGEKHHGISDEAPGEPTFLYGEGIFRRVELEPVLPLEVRPELAQEEPEHREGLRRLDGLDAEEVLGLFGGVERARIHAVGHEKEREDHRGGEHEGDAPSAHAQEHSPTAPRDVPSLAHGVEVEEAQRGETLALDRVLDDVEGVLAGTHGGWGLRRGNVDALAPEVALELLVLALVFAGARAARHASRGGTADADAEADVAAGRVRS